MTKIAVLGSGSWGLTLAMLAVQAKNEVWLWGRNTEKINGLKANRQIAFPLAMTLPESIQLTDSLDEALAGADVALLVVTSSGTREMLERIAESASYTERLVILNASKGIEYPSLKSLSTVIEDVLPNNPAAVISGPTLAPEIVTGRPTAAVIGCKDMVLAKDMQQWLTSDTFRLYTNPDVLGVELGGSLKNIFAIVSGYMEAKNLGDNAKATLITRGLAEMTRFCTLMGADVQTLYGLSGLGDLLATCNSPLSRNYQVGYQLAQGKSLEQILTDLKMVAEGIQTTRAVSQIAINENIDMPVVQQVAMALGGNFSEREIITTLMSRKLKSENIPAL